VGQLVTEELLAVGRLGIVLARRKVEVGAVGEGQGADRGRFMTDVNGTSAKLVLKKASIFFWTVSGRGWPLPRGLSVKFPG